MMFAVTADALVLSQHQAIGNHHADSTATDIYV